MRVLIVEDSPTHSAECVGVLTKFASVEVAVIKTVALALMRLEDVIEGSVPAPDLIVLDLDFYGESGFEVPRWGRWSGKSASTLASRKWFPSGLEFENWNRR